MDNIPTVGEMICDGMPGPSGLPVTTWAVSDNDGIRHYMTYKGYKGSVEYSDEDHLLYGQILDVPDTNMYEGKSLKQLRRDFKVAVKIQIKTDRRRRMGTL